MSIKFVDIVEERSRSVIKCEKSVITVILIRFNYLIYSLDKYTIILSIETSILDSFAPICQRLKYNRICFYFG